MKRILILLIVLYNFVYAQDFNFNTHVSDALDKWVVFNKNDDGNPYAYGFVYVDIDAGFTFNLESMFFVKNGKFDKLPRDPTANMKYRLGANTALVHLLTDDEIKQLELPKQPHWLEIYKSNNIGISYLKNMGKHYNHIGAIEKSTPLLEKAYLENPHYEGLEFELAFAYNAAKNFDKAIEVLVKAIANNKDNFWFYRELGYSYLSKNDIANSEDIYRKGINLSKDKIQNFEMALNMTRKFFEIRNKEKFDEWIKISRIYSPEQEKLDQFVKYCTDNWDKK